jgi:Protein of unknown function (DUF1084)
MLLSSLYIPIKLLWAKSLYYTFLSRLFMMLQRFPVESKGRRKKLNEVIIICFFFLYLAFGFSMYLPVFSTN